MKNTFSQYILKFFYSFLPVICFWSFSFTSQAQPIKDWDRDYGGAGWEDCNAAIQTSDFGYLLGGITTSDISGDVDEPSLDDFSIPFWLPNIRGDYWVLRTDEDGNELWNARFGGDKEDRLWGVSETDDGGFILGGQSYSGLSGTKSDTCRGSSDYWIVKIDGSGVKQWDRTYGGDSTDILNVLLQTQDGGYILGGLSISSGWTATDSLGEKSDPLRGGYDWWIVKIDPLGDIEWERSYGGNQNEQLADIVQRADGTYVVAGGSESTVSGEVDSLNVGSRDFWMLHLDVNGDKLNEYRYGSVDFDDLNRVIITNDGGYFLAGSSLAAAPSGDKTDPGQGSFDWWVLKIDTFGTIEWQHTFGGSDLENVYSISQNSIDHYLLGGPSGSIDGDLADNVPRGSSDYWIMYLDPDGNRLWDERYGGDDAESLEQLFQTNDGGYLMAGHSRSDVSGDKEDPNKGLNDFWIVKTACSINLELNDTIVCPDDEVILSAYDPDCIDCVYTWSDIGTTNDSIRLVNAVSDITYSVTLTDGVGCQRSDEINVTVVESPLVDLGSNIILCDGESITLDAGDEGLSYQWSTNENTQSINVDTTANYIVTVTGNNNCITEDSVQVIVNEAIELELGNDTTLCEGNSLLLNATVGTNLSYQWTNNANTPSILVSSTDTYGVTVTDSNNCSTSDEITVNFTPAPQEINLAALDPGPFCPGTSFGIIIQDSELGVIYELFDGTNTSGGAVLGNGSAVMLSTAALSNTTNFNIIASINGACSDTLMASTTANIGDVEVPLITCRSDTTIIIENGNCNPELAVAAPVQAVDNCGIESLTYSFSGATVLDSPPIGINDASGQMLNAGLTTISYIATDSFGNIASCTFTVDVLDETNPLMGNSANDLIVECDGTGNSLAFNNWLANHGGATAFDDCSAITWSTIPANPVISDGCGETGSVEVTFVATDESGNTISSVAMFTIEDTQAPTFTVPFDITIAATEDPLDLGITGDVIDEADNCDGGVGDQGARFATYADIIQSDACMDIITRTWTLSDECGNTFSTEQTITQIFNPPTGSLAGNTEICEGESVILIFNLAGTSNVFNVIYTDGDNDFSINGITTGHSIELTPDMTTNYSLVSVEDVSRLGCTGVGIADVEIIVNEVPTIENIAETCDVLNAAYTVTFEITGGVEGTYSVTGNYASVLNGNTVISAMIPRDSSYFFLIEDENGCGPVEVSGTYDCPCVTEAGTFQENTLMGCIGETLFADHIGSNLDGNDLINFILHDGDANTIGNTIFSSSPVAEFSLQNGMLPGMVYYVTIVAGTDDGNGQIATIDACYSESTGVPIIFNELPTAVITPITDTELNCDEPELSLTGMNSQAQGMIDFQWLVLDNGNITSTDNGTEVTLDEIGNYQLLITDQLTGCTAATAINITIDENKPNAVIADPTDLTCDVLTVQLDAMASSTGLDFTYQWTGGMIEAGAQTLSPVVSASGLYTLVVTDVTNGCTEDEQVFVETNYATPSVSVEATDMLDCNTAEIILNGSYTSTDPNVSINWLTSSGNIISGGNTLNPVVDAAGVYTLVVTNLSTGCLGEIDVIVDLDPATPQGLSITSVAPQCFGDDNGSISILEVIGGTAPFSYSINGTDFNTSTDFLNLAAGQFDLIVKDALGCTWDTLVNLSAPPELFVELGDNLEIDLGDSIQLDAFVNQPIDTFVWNQPELTNLNPTVQPANQTTYIIEVMNDLGCVAEDFITIIVRKDRNIYIPTAFSPNGDGANDKFIIFSDQSVVNIKTFQIFNRWGETLFVRNDLQPNVEPEGWDGRFKGRDMQPGVYIFFAEIEFFDGRTEVFKGDFTLLR